VIEIAGEIIKKRTKKDPCLFKQYNVNHPKLLTDLLSLAMEEIISQDNKRQMKLLYRVFKDAIEQNDSIFTYFADKKDFININIVKVVNSLASSLQKKEQRVKREHLKKIQLLLNVILIAVTKTAVIKNKHVFTLEILDN